MSVLYMYSIILAGFPTGLWHSAHAASCQWIVKVKNQAKDPVID